jgi:phosphoglycerol transferase MdoB-like AlkP superfamily enzyme
VVTAEMALAYLEKERPRFLYLSLGETDDWAHERRYDRVLEMAVYFDETLKRLWDWTQSQECYRDRTLFVVTSDHGRGKDEETWISHGRPLPEAANTWVALRGPGIPAVSSYSLDQTLYQTAIAPTIAWGFGLDPKKYYSEADQPIPVQAGWTE